MINVSMDGVKEAIEAVKDIIAPAQRKEAERKVRLENTLRQAEIHKLNAETLAAKAKTDRENAAAAIDHAQAELLLAQAKKTEAEAELIRAQAVKTLAEAEKEREAIRLERIKLAMEIIEKYNPNSEGPQKINFVIRLLPDLDQLMSSDLVLVE